MARLKRGDVVRVIRGKDRGREGKVLRVIPETPHRPPRVIIEGVNMVKRHTKPNPKNPQGGIVEREAPIAAAKAMPIDPRAKAPTRIGWKWIEEAGARKKVRIARRSGEVLA